MNIDTLDKLRALYPAPRERALRKQLAALDAHCRRFIELSPFVVIASSSADRAMDASPRGGPPGFIKVQGERTLLVPDAPGNNRLDTLENIIATGTVGLLFMVPGVDETLRVNGAARLSCEAAHLLVFAAEKRRPRLVVEVSVAEAYLHCAKAFMRSKLWDHEAWSARSAMPTLGEILRDQLALPQNTAELDSALAESYRQTMW